MMFSLAEALLFAALVATTACLVPMYMRLKRLDRYHAQYRDMVDWSASALVGASNAVQSFAQDGRVVLEDLSREIECAKVALAELKAERIRLANAAQPGDASPEPAVGGNLTSA
ncbi:hypothetical protein MCBMB27_01341 [Methylobacterium phyllosphaerae]|jgi:hypothetical protein|uniref:Uncharacterized protein n=2 Tax=Methylobacterium TaxID=407 RepID=A0AAE8HMQ1_9HYPH|nr:MULTISPECIES: hypothetical protein [Methylobacterium]APT30632.1 hypothetical protein MCBMB27_01341 [Methylobacterium phyllosphaerae]MDH3027852.1 hypothetical protein [Methylobacterium fujisawaense]SFG22233.1 hypothetical protein SAMN05192567_101126 [Methylobacterium phyllosphaerae]